MPAPSRCAPSARRRQTWTTSRWCCSARSPPARRWVTRRSAWVSRDAPRTGAWRRSGRRSACSGPWRRSRSRAGRAGWAEAALRVPATRRPPRGGSAGGLTRRFADLALTAFASPQDGAFSRGKERLAVGAVGREAGDARRDRDGPPVDRRELRDAIEDASRDHVAGRSGRHEHELVAAPARDGVHEPDGLREHGGDLAEDVVARL